MQSEWRGIGMNIGYWWEKSEVKRSLGKSRCMWVENFEIDHREVG
jgi:hypothetical protein